MFNSFPKKPGPYVPKGGATGEALVKKSNSDYDSEWVTGGAGAPGPGYYATSTTSLLIAIASKSFTTQSGLAYSIGARVRASSAAGPTNFMEGSVTSYSGTTLILNIDYISGSGTLADWNINLAGEVGPAGDPGAAAGFGGAITIGYTFSTTITDADPTNGKLRLGSSTQNTSTVIRADLLDNASKDWTTVLDTIDDSSSLIKGQIRLCVATDASKFLVFNVTALASPSGYKNITVACIGYSAANPFINNDSIILSFTRNGDAFVSRVVTATSSATPSIDCAATDFYSLTSQTVDITSVTITGTPTDRQPLWICIKGTASRAITWGSQFAGTTISLPFATVNTDELKVGFLYSSARSVWECCAVV